jgi:membrane fusion protein (multidrug efflux system)
MCAPATQPSSCSNPSTVRAVSLHMAIVVASLFAASVTLVGCGPGASHAQGAPGAGGPPPAAVVVMSLAATNLAMDYEYVGQTAGSRDVEVRARVAGILLKRNFTEGGSVKKGQSLYSLDPEPFQAAFNRADADVVAAEARLAQTTRTLNRLKPLWEARAVSPRDYDDAASTDQVTRADL